IVERDRPPRATIRVAYRLGVAMHALLGGREDRAAIGQRHDGLRAPLHVRGPKFELTTVLWLPVAIEIDQQVDASFEIERRVVVEVRVDRQMPALGDLMKASPNEVGVGHESLDAGDVLDNPDERSAVERVEQASQPRLEKIWM